MARRGRIVRLRGEGRWDAALELAGDDHLLRADLLNEQALFAGAADARRAATLELDRAEARLEMERGRVLHARFLEERGAEDPRELAHFEAALAAARRGGDPLLEGWARFWIGLVHQVARGDDRAALGHLEAAVAAGRQQADTMLVSYAIRHLAFAWENAGRHDDAWRGFEESVALRRHDGFWPGVAAGLLTLAEVAYEHGRSAEARRLAAEAAEIAGRCGATAFLERARAFMGRIGLADGAPESP